MFKNTWHMQPLRVWKQLQGTSRDTTWSLQMQCNWREHIYQAENGQYPGQMNWHVKMYEMLENSILNLLFFNPVTITFYNYTYFDLFIKLQLNFLISKTTSKSQGLFQRVKTLIKKFQKYKLLGNKKKDTSHGTPTLVTAYTFLHVLRPLFKTFIICVLKL